MKELKGENFVELKEYFEDEEGYYIVMEYCDCNLSDLLNSKYQEGMSIELIKKIFSQLNKALLKMNQSNITHRDLKPANILIKFIKTDSNENEFIVKLSDFGLSTELSITQSELSFAGTFNYMAPEVENRKYSNKVDLWSIGIILYELKTCKYIFEGKNKEEEIHNRYNGIIKKTGYYVLDNLISKLIIVDTNLRISWDNYFIDKFFIEGFDAGKIIDYEFKIQPPPIGTGKIFIKIGFVGDCGAGRSVLLHRFVNKRFKIQVATTYPSPNEIYIKDKIILYLLDCPGFKKYISIIKLSKRSR